MRLHSFAATLCFACGLVFVSSLAAQDLGPNFKKLKDGIYVESSAENNSNCGIILTQEGVILIDSGHNPTDSRAVMEAVKKLTPLPIRFLIDTEIHPDHTTGHFVFSPPATIIAHQGGGEAMKKAFDPERIKTLAAQSPAMRDAVEGYRLVTPQVEYQEKTTINLGERTLELIHLKNVHSESDTAVWLPKERILFSASAAIPGSYNNLRAFVSIPDMLSAIQMMKSLNPEIVVAGHGPVGTTKIFDDSTRFYNLLLERVGKLAKEGMTLDQIKQELKMPEYDNWAAKDRIPSNVEAAYRAVKGS